MADCVEAGRKGCLVRGADDGCEDPLTHAQLHDRLSGGTLSAAEVGDGGGAQSENRRIERVR
jgi:hypothetical protein